jgi:hypothetical protein
MSATLPPSVKNVTELRQHKKATTHDGLKQDNRRLTHGKRCSCRWKRRRKTMDEATLELLLIATIIGAAAMLFIFGFFLIFVITILSGDRKTGDRKRK